MSNFPILVKTPLIFPVPWASAPFPKRGVRALHNNLLTVSNTKSLKLHLWKFYLWVLKECSNEISSILALIYNESLARGDVPDEWRQANVSPVFRKGEKYDAANYRPVSLTCICCKTLEHILVSNINKHLALKIAYLLTVSMVSEIRGLVKPSWSSLCTTSSATWMGLWIVGTNRQI